MAVGVLEDGVGEGPVDGTGKRMSHVGEFHQLGAGGSGTAAATRGMARLSTSVASPGFAPPGNGT